MHTEHGGEACLEGTFGCQAQGKSSKHFIGVVSQALVISGKAVSFLVI